MRNTVAGQTRLNGSNAIHPGLVIARGRPAATCASVALTRLWQVAVQADMCGFGLALWCLCPASTVGNVAASRAQGRYSAKTEAIGTRMPDGNGAMHALQAPPAGWVSPSICAAAAAAASQQLLHSGCPLSSLFTKFISNSFLHTVLPFMQVFPPSCHRWQPDRSCQDIVSIFRPGTTAPGLDPIVVDVARRPALVVIVADGACLTRFSLMGGGDEKDEKVFSH
jgi:hypothetical protein